MSWILAVKQWNAGKDAWCIPRKGSPAYHEVKAIMDGSKSKAPTSALKEKKCVSCEKPSNTPPTIQQKIIQPERFSTIKEYKKQFYVLDKIKNDAFLRFTWNNSLHDELMKTELPNWRQELPNWKLKDPYIFGLLNNLKNLKSVSMHGAGRNI